MLLSRGGQAFRRTAGGLLCRGLSSQVINGNQVRPGNILKLKTGKLVEVKKAQAVKPGKGGAYMQVELKDIKTGVKTQERLRSSESVEKVRLDDEEEYTFLYREGNKLVLMHKGNFTQEEVPADIMSDVELKFLEEDVSVFVQNYENTPLVVKLPREMTVTVKSTEPYAKGSQASPTFKPAVLHNGVQIKVPPFVEEGEKIIMSTESMEYVSRVT